MTLALLGLLACAFASALYSGGETAIYSLSRLRLEVEAAKGARAAQRVQELFADEILLLVTILVGNNLMLELASHCGDAAAEHLGVPEAAREIVVTLTLTPLFFIASELFPKDLFRRRPHGLLPAYGHLLWASSWVFRPLAWPLVLLSRLARRWVGARPDEPGWTSGQRRVATVLAEGRAAGAIPAAAEALLNNVLALKEVPIARVMIPWEQVETLSETDDDAEQRVRVGTSDFSRLPLIAAGGEVTGYVYQLDVLAAPDVDVVGQRRTVPFLAPETPIDRALARLRTVGARAAVVGAPDAPSGWVTLKDLVEEISGELTRW